MSSTLVVVTQSAACPERLFDVSLSIDEHLGSMAGSGERAVAGVTSGLIGLGETVTWRARHFGVWFTMTSRIEELERPRAFVDQQLRGPFKLFRHEHLFEPLGTGTLMTDTITLASPVGGVLAERLFLVPYLRRLILQRNRHLLASLE